MDKILSINTIKNVFSALGAKTSDDNYGVALLDKTTAEPKGLMDIPNFASVLGVGLSSSSIKLTQSNRTVTAQVDYGIYLLRLNSTTSPVSAILMLLDTTDLVGCVFSTAFSNRLDISYTGFDGQYLTFTSKASSDYIIYLQKVFDK